MIKLKILTSCESITDFVTFLKDVTHAIEGGYTSGYGWELILKVKA